jgi:hypothetical protein
VKQSKDQRVETRTCPKHVTRELTLAGGLNPYGKPMFRVTWGYNRIVPFTGNWQEFEQVVCTLTDKVTGYSESRLVTKLVREVVETRMLPKYLPANAWHLEMWRPAAEYGYPEDWRKAGQEVLQGMTIDTAGPYPEQGEYELCYPITHDGTSHGQPIELYADVVAELVRMIQYGKQQFTFLQRKAAIEQRERKKEEGFMERTMAILKDGMPAFAGEPMISVPDRKLIVEP